MRAINFSDDLEEKIAKALNKVGIVFIHESEDKAQLLDFYLPYFDVYLEVKKYHADRISRQMASMGNVIAIQGVKSVNLIVIILLRSKRQNAV